MYINPVHVCAIVFLDHLSTQNHSRFNKTWSNYSMVVILKISMMGIFFVEIS